MKWEVWDVESGNVVGWRDTEAEALALVRNLIVTGWPVSALSLLAEDESRPLDALPPTLSGDDLARRAEATDEGRTRRTA
jgi:hypothetical protein